MVWSSFVLSESAALLTQILSTQKQEKEKISSIRKSNKKTTTSNSNKKRNRNELREKDEPHCIGREPTEIRIQYTNMNPRIY